MFFSMLQESCAGNSFLLDRLSIRNFTWRFWGDWERMCEENAQNCGNRVIGFSVMTTSQLTQLCPWSCIWPLWDGPSFPHPPYSPDLAPSDLSLFPTMKKTLKGKRFATWRRWKQLSRRHSTSSFSSSKDPSHSGKKRLDKCIASNGEYFERD